MSLSALKRYALPVLDAAAILAGTYLAYSLRFEGVIPRSYRTEMPWTMVVSVVVFVFWLAFFHMYRRLWRYASIVELITLVRAAVAGTVTLYILRALQPWFVLPRSVVLIEGLLVLAFTGGLRFLLRIRHGLAAPTVPEGRPGNGERLLIVGAGDAGVMTLREIRQATNWTVVGLADDDPEKHRQRVLGVPVLGGRKQIPELVRQHRVTQVLIAMPSAPRSIIRETLDQARRAGCTVRTVPALYELMDGQMTVTQIREVRIEDLLRRDPVPLDVKAVRSYLEGKVVLVTGAGGSIGSELCRQVARCAPSRLILLGHGENSIFEILQELRSSHPALGLTTAIADMREERKVESLFAAYRPAVVFHAAAHKHVPLMEAHPDEAVTNNVFGTLNLCLAAERFGAERFVMISTDKAVNPTNAMGASKRVAEMIVQNMNWRSTTRFVAVRFGNVLGSRGSVIPTFTRQIASGGPVTVTHPEMQRYFMTIPEAVQLVLEAGHLAEGGEIYLLEMGEPVKIVDLARDMIRLSGFEPEVDIPIVFTGTRPGEKLFEELRTDTENVERTSHPDIVRLHGQEVDPPWLEYGLEVLRVHLQDGDLSALKAALVALGQGQLPSEPGVAQVAARHLTVRHGERPSRTRGV